MRSPFLFLLYFLFVFNANAQINVPSGILEDYNYTSYLSSGQQLNKLLRTVNYSIDTLDWNPLGSKNNNMKRFRLLNPELRTSFNTGYARGFNDGAIWKGKGLTQEVHAGFTGNYGIFHYTLLPNIFHSQNQDFELAENSNEKINPYNIQYYSDQIDFVQRYGRDSFWEFNLGQSDIRLIKNNYTIGVSTQNLTFGPSLYNPIILSKNAPGIPHIELGTYKPIDLKWKNTYLGKYYISFYWGLLNESEYYDMDDDNDKRYFTAARFHYETPFIKGLTIGLMRSFTMRVDDFQTKDLMRTFAYYNKKDNVVINENGGITNDFLDQIASFFFNWYFEKEELRGYFEFIKNDFNGSIGNLLIDPEHASAYTIGLEKLWRGSEDERLRFFLEYTNIILSRNFYIRGTGTFYTHSRSKQGHTQQGQLLGAGIGPGSNSFLLGVNGYKKQRFYTFYTQFIQLYEDYYFRRAYSLVEGLNRSEIEEQVRSVFQRSTELTFNFKYLRPIKQLYCGFDLSWSRNFNRNFIISNHKDNWYISLAVQYRIN